MQATLSSIEEEALRLPEDQKLTLAHRILCSAEPPLDPAIDALWEKEIVRRIARLDSGETGRHDAAEVLQRPCSGAADLMVL